MIVTIEKARLAFPDLFEAKPFKAGDPPRFSANFLIPKDDKQIATIEAAIKEVAVEKWNKQADAILKSIRNNPMKFALRDGDAKTYDGFAGNFYVAATNKKRPIIADRDKTPLVEADGKPYAGCYVRATVDIYAQDNDNGKAIYASLRTVQFHSDGDAFSSGTPVTDDELADLADGANAE